MEMQLINGKFYLDGKPYPIEFGNKEQIDLIRKEQLRVSEIEGEGIVHEVETSFLIRINFNCICGNRLTQNFICESDDAYELEDQGLYCKKCKREYNIIPESFTEVRIKQKKYGEGSKY